MLIYRFTKLIIIASALVLGACGTVQTAAVSDLPASWDSPAN